MNNRYVYLIIVAFYVIAHIISVIEKARKERLKKQAQMQRGQTTVAAQPSATPASPREMPLETRPGWSRTPPAASGLPGPLPGIPQASRSPSARPADDLAARRKAQLDELRRRRGQTGAPARPIAPTPSGPTLGSPAPAPSRPPMPMPRQAPLDAGRLAKAEAERRRQAETKAARERALQQALSAAGHMERQQARAAEAAAASAAQLGGAPQGSQSANAARKIAAVRNVASGAALKDRNMLRQALILRELLDPPISIR